MNESLYAFLILSLMIPLIIISIYIFKRFIIKVPSGNDIIEISAQLSLGAKERLLLVRANGKSMLIGTTPQSITTLHVFDNEDGVFASQATNKASVWNKKSHE